MGRAARMACGAARRLDDTAAQQTNYQAVVFVVSSCSSWWPSVRVVDRCWEFEATSLSVSLP